MQFGVITSVERSGNMATALGSIFFKIQEGSPDNDWENKYEHVPFDQAVDVYQQVFYKGEILILDLDGREIGGHGRKPSKWDVQYDVFDNIEDAVQYSQQVTRETGAPESTPS